MVDVSPEQIQEVKTMLDRLNGVRDLDLKTDVLNGLKEFSSMVARQDGIKQSYVFSGDYKPSDAAAIIADAEALQKKLETAVGALGNKASDKATRALGFLVSGGVSVDDQLTEAFEGRKFPARLKTNKQKAEDLIKLLKTVPDLVQTLDDLKQADWKVETTKQEPEEKNVKDTEQDKIPPQKTPLEIAYKKGQDLLQKHAKADANGASEAELAALAVKINAAIDDVKAKMDAEIKAGTFQADKFKIGNLTLGQQIQNVRAEFGSGKAVVQKKQAASQSQVSGSVSVVDSIKAVETTLQNVIAPFMLKEAEVKLEFDGAPDGAFDEKSEKALQMFLVGFDYKKDGLLGDKPWFYTKENGAKLSDSIKKHLRDNPGLVVDQMNENSKEAAKKNGNTPKDVVKVEEGKLKWLVDDESGENLFKKGDDVSDDFKEVLFAKLDKDIDDFILHLNALEEARIFQDKQLASRADMLPANAGIFIRLIAFFFNLMGIKLDGPLVDKINDFTTKVFDIDIKEMIPKDMMSGEYDMDSFVGPNTFDQVKETYRKAMAETDDPAALQAQIKEGMVSIFGAESSAIRRFDELVAPHAQKMMDDLGEKPEGGYTPEQLDAAAANFAASLDMQALHTQLYEDKQVEDSGLTIDGIGKGANKVLGIKGADNIIRPKMDDLLDNYRQSATPFKCEKMFVLPEIEVDYSDDSYTNPRAGGSEVYDSNAAYKYKIKGLKNNSAIDSATTRGEFKDNAFQKTLLKTYERQLTHEIGRVPLGTVDKHGDVKLLFVDHERLNQIKQLRADVGVAEGNVAKHNKKITNEAHMIVRLENQIETSPMSDQPNKEQLRVRVAQARSNLYDFLNSDEVVADLEALRQKEALLAEMEGTQFRMVDPTPAGYAKILEQRKYSTHYNPESIRDYAVKRLRKDHGYDVRTDGLAISVYKEPTPEEIKAARDRKVQERKDARQEERDDRKEDRDANQEDRQRKRGKKKAEREAEKEARQKARDEKKAGKEPKAKTNQLGATFNEDAKGADIQKKVDVLFAPEKKNEWKSEVAALGLSGKALENNTDPKVAVTVTT